MFEQRSPASARRYVVASAVAPSTVAAIGTISASSTPQLSASTCYDYATQISSECSDGAPPPLSTTTCYDYATQVYYQCSVPSENSVPPGIDGSGAPLPNPDVDNTFPS